LVVVIAGGVLLALMLVLGRRFAGSGGSESSLAAQPPRESQTVESAPAKSSVAAPEAESPLKSHRQIQSPASGAANETEPMPHRRVALPEAVSRGLRIITATPVYPPLARQARIQGEVVLDADIAKDGTIETLRAISGHPLLVPAAVEAVKQWRYKPYKQNGAAVAVNTQITLEFTLAAK
jgi:TonB family protein